MDIEEIKKHILYLYNNRLNKKWIPTWFDFVRTIALPMEDVVNAYNELVETKSIEGVKGYLPK